MKGRTGFTLVEILVAIAIILVITALVAPAILEAKARGKATMCASNIRQLTLAQHLYMQSNEGYVAAEYRPERGYWFQQLVPYGLTRELRCPAYSGITTHFGAPLVGYARNLCFARESSVLDPSKQIAFAEVGVAYSTSRQQLGVFAPIVLFSLVMPDSFQLVLPRTFAQGYKVRPEPPFGAERHAKGSNYSFVDGHLKWFLPSMIRFTPKWNTCTSRSSVFPGSTEEDWVGPKDGPFFKPYN